MNFESIKLNVTVLGLSHLLTRYLPVTEEPLVIVKKETNQFVVAHCQRSMRVLYNVSGWLRRAREHPSYRVVAQVLSESKRY